LTIYDIAREADVSIATVSRVINNPEKVSPKKRAIVKAVLEKYNYTPNAMAQALVNNSSKTIGILVSDITNIHFTRSAYILENLFFKWGYTTLLCNTGDDLNKKIEYIRILSGKKVDGLIMLGSIFKNDKIKDIILDYMPNIPVVTSNVSLFTDNFYSVEVDHSAGMDYAIKHLIERGFNSIYFVQGNETLNTLRKAQAFCVAYQNNKVAGNPKENILTCTHGALGGRQFAEKLFPKINNERKALIFIDDYTAIGAVSQFRKMGVDIPNKLGIIGHDNSTFSICSEPQLTTIDTQIEAISNIIGNTLNNIFNNIQVSKSVIVQPELIIRETT